MLIIQYHALMSNAHIRYDMKTARLLSSLNLLWALLIFGLPIPGMFFFFFYLKITYQISNNNSIVIPWKDGRLS